MEHDDFVDYYAKGTASFPVFFPHGKVDCRHCNFIRYKEPFNIYQCVLTDALVEKNDLTYRHQLCPIEFEESPF